MAEASVPVDLFNPGQVFACIGLAEAADVLIGGAEAAFDWSDPKATVFRLRTTGNEPPVLTVLQFIDVASSQAIAPAGSPNLNAWKSGWGLNPAAVERTLGYPFPDPSSPATLICRLTDGDRTLTLDYWGDATGRDNVKFWSGAGGFPGAALASNALQAIRGKAALSVTDPFALAAPQRSSFRLDWRRDYIPIHSGFSLNAHKGISAMGFPLVELLGAIGLTNARPLRPDRRNKLDYKYAVCGRAAADDAAWLALPYLRAALGISALPFPMRRFRMLLERPDKESRSITTVTEENLA